MNTKKKFHLSIFAAIYGFASAILTPVFLAMNHPRGFDAPVTDELMLSITIDFVIGVIGVILSVIYSKKLAKEKIKSLSENTVTNICHHCNLNVLPGTDVCPNCGNKINK